MNRKTTAYHEAGHVIMYLITDECFKSVTIVPGDYLGCVQNLGNDVSSGALCLLGGEVATSILHKQRAFKRYFDPDYTGDYTSDFRDANDYIQRGNVTYILKNGKIVFTDNFDEKNELIKLIKSTRDTLKKRWDDVVKIAEELLKKNTLTYDECVKIIEES